MVQLQSIRLTMRPVFVITWFTILVILVFAGPILWLVKEWQDNQYYEHGPFVPLVSIALVILTLPRLVPPVGQTTRAGPILFIVGLSLRFVSLVTGSEFLGALALVILLAGLAGWWLGRKGLQSTAFPISYLLLAVPLPFMDDLGFYFQRLSTVSTTVLIKLAGVPATYQGAEISLPDASFIVGIQCSGLYSTVSLTALGLLFVRLLDLHSWRRRLLLIAAIPIITVVANIFRLGSILGLAYWQNSDIAIHYYHNFAGIVFWLLAMGMLFAVGKGLEWTQSPDAS
ncbi:MAG: exosortase/archaeosortase family protein [Chloroflexi bacterium]|nr:exosortase/archaeosortase family protein [Chloroflexota bacterium]